MTWTTIRLLLWAGYTTIIPYLGSVYVIGSHMSLLILVRLLIRFIQLYAVTDRYVAPLSNGAR
jgi:hypothetical protein